MLLLGAGACPQGNYTHLYQTQPLAPGYSAADVAALDHLGAQVVGGGINFGVYSENATKVQVLLFDDPEAPLPSQQFDMVEQGDVWNVWVSGIGLNQAYGYVAWGPNWPYDPSWHPGTITGFQADVDSAGNRFDPNKLLLDPYAPMMTRDFDWTEGSAASGPDRTVLTYQAAGKAITAQSQYAWSANESQWLAARQDPNMPGHRPQDLIVYEVHPKGFTASPASGVAHPGTFRGVGEDADYLKDLGINAVEFLPVMAKSTDGGYWGYDTLAFFIPELTYVSLLDPKHPEAAIDEFKWMVDQLHQRGIEVFLDVVYNHTGEGGLWRQEIQFDDVPPLPNGAPQLTAFDPKEVASILSWRGLDNQAYYALDPTNQFYWDNTGVGQETRPNHLPMTRLILDSLHYWVSEMHVDGFRFDEAAILGETSPAEGSCPEHCWADPTKTVLQTIADDPLLQKDNIRIVAEPWSGAGDWQTHFPSSTTLPGYGWGEWNGPFRDWWRSMANVAGWTFNSTIWSPIGQENGGFFLFGSHDFFAPNGREPYNSYNFVTIHDGFTMYDLFSYDQKVNGCGPLNPACCTEQLTTYCNQTDGVDNNISKNWGSGSEDVKRELMRDMFVAMIVSHGTPLLLGGDEWMRTQLGNNNAYSTLADSSYNWFDWGSWQADPHRLRMHDFVRQLLAFRKAYGYALAPSDWSSGVPVSWEDAAAGQPANWNSAHLAMHYPASAAGPEIDVLFNFETTMTDFTLPPGSWTSLLDTQTYYDEDAYFGAGASGSPDPKSSANIWVQSPIPLPPGPSAFCPCAEGATCYCAQPRSIVVVQGAAATQ